MPPSFAPRREVRDPRLADPARPPAGRSEPPAAPSPAPSSAPAAAPSVARSAAPVGAPPATGGRTAVHDTAGRPPHVAAFPVGGATAARERPSGAAPVRTSTDHGRRLGRVGRWSWPLVALVALLLALLVAALTDSVGGAGQGAAATAPATACPASAVRAGPVGAGPTMG